MMYASERGWANDRPRVRRNLFVVTGRFAFANGLQWDTELYRGLEAECRRVAKACYGGYSECRANPVVDSHIFVGPLEDWIRYLEQE